MVKSYYLTVDLEYAKSIEDELLEFGDAVPTIVATDKMD